MSIHWLLIGIGDIARKRVIPAILADPRSALTGFVTRDAHKAEAYPGTHAWPTLEAALANGEKGAAAPKIDAVYIASPVAFHAPQAIAALQAGKHVLCEKPVAMNYAEAASITEAARVSGKLFGVSYYRRFYPKLVRAKELIAAGAIGQPLFAEGIYHGWLESEERGWLRDPALAGGGPLYDVASHRIDAANFLFGKPERATGLRSNALHDLKVEDSATVLIGYAGGVHAVVDARWNSRIARDEFRIIGTEGALELTPLNGPDLRGPSIAEHLPVVANAHAPAIENFVAAILDDAPLTCPGEEAIWTDWITEQVMRRS